MQNSKHSTSLMQGSKPGAGALVSAGRSRKEALRLFSSSPPTALKTSSWEEALRGRFARMPAACTSAAQRPMLGSEPLLWGTPLPKPPAAAAAAAPELDLHTHTRTA